MIFCYAFYHVTYSLRLSSDVGRMMDMLPFLTWLI